MKNIKKGFQLFWFFFRIGFFHLRRGLEYRGTDSEGICGKAEMDDGGGLLDTVSVGRSLPGLMIGNVSFMFGYQNGGVFCAIMSLLGISVPALLIMTVVTMCYTKIKDNLYGGARHDWNPCSSRADHRFCRSAATKRCIYG